MDTPGKLFVVPTPVGNLEDMTFRAVRILKEADLILAEDTRVSMKLLNHYNIRNTLSSHHKFNEHGTAMGIAMKIKEGMCVALISDAGTPGISDPGYLLVKRCLDHGVEVECLPGATSFVPALVNSGLPSDRFIFEGFLPLKKGRMKRLSMLEDDPRTLLFFESPHRLVKLLQQLSVIFGKERRCSVARELSKLYEENVRGSLEEVLLHFTQNPPRGEIVVVVEGKPKSKSDPEEDEIPLF